MPKHVERLRELLATASVKCAESQLETITAPPIWGRDQLSGRLTEISGLGAVSSLTSAVGLVLDAQLNADPVAWITLPGTSFYPPDAADSGVDLAALAIVRVPGAIEAARAAEQLVRSGAFGLIILDLGRDARIPTALQGRLVNLAKQHDTALVCLTAKSREAGSLGSMVSLRAEAVREKQNDGHFCCRIQVIKDKRRGPNWNHSEVVHGPDGLC